MFKHSVRILALVILVGTIMALAVVWREMQPKDNWSPHSDHVPRVTFPAPNHSR